MFEESQNSLQHACSKEFKHAGKGEEIKKCGEWLHGPTTAKPRLLTIDHWGLFLSPKAIVGDLNTVTTAGNFFYIIPRIPPKENV